MKTISKFWINFVRACHNFSGTSKISMFVVIAILALVHIALTIKFKDFTWFASFGALLSVFGLLVSFSYAIPVQEISAKDLAPTKEGDIYVDGGTLLGNGITNVEEIEKIKKRNINSVLKNYENVSVYIILSVIGTLIWAYGGFLNLLFFKCV